MRSYENVLRWFSHVERIEDRIAKRMYVGVCAGSHSVTKGFMKVFSDGSAMWRELRMTALLKKS